MNNLERKNNIAIVIPFYNEEETIVEIVNKCSAYSNHLILVNDGSTDNSLQLIPKLDINILVSHSSNLGKGAALKTGYKTAFELDSKYLIQIDADLQHDPDRIPEFVEQLSNYDMVIGNRMNDKSNMPIHRKLSNYLTTKLLSYKSGIKLLDSQSGFRGFRIDCLEKILPERNGFESESEMILRAASQNMTIGFVDIPTRYGDDNSKMNSFTSTINFINLLFTNI